MPLDRAHVTAASRVMLPTYPAFFGGLGAGLLLTPTQRLTSSISTSGASDSCSSPPSSSQHSSPAGAAPTSSPSAAPSAG